jgi:hydrogenase maturation protein HypF
MALEWAADPAERGSYPFDLVLSAQPWQVDLRPLVRAAVGDLLAGRSPALVAARFHETLAEVAGALVEEAVRRHGILPVALSGGCFQNARLVEACLRRLEGARVIRHERVPPGDGGVALGQALVADAAVRHGRCFRR